MRDKIRVNVENLLIAYPEYRSSDKDLLIAYMTEYFDLRKELNTSKNPHATLKEIIMAMPSFESITRARRDLQEDGSYPAEKHVQEERKLLEIEYRNKYSR